MTKGSLLGRGDPAPVEVFNADGRASLLLVCEHAGQAVPEKLSVLGMSRAQMDEHIGWDVGAAAVTRHMAMALDAPAVLQPYSRLVIDCNRPPRASDSIPECSDGHVVPGNVSITAEDRAARINAIFEPFQAEVAVRLKRPGLRAVFSIHSFTPRMNRIERPWDVGFLFRADTETSAALAGHLVARDPAMVIGMNQPYQIEDDSDWFVPRHGEPSGLPHSLIEIRNDHLQTAEGRARWAALLTEAIHSFIKELKT